MVKAGNSKGTSTLTEPLKFTVGDKYVTSAASQESDGHVGVAVAVVLALVAVASICAGAVWFIRTRKLLVSKNSNGIAFENPSYLREVNMDHMQVRKFLLKLQCLMDYYCKRVKFISLIEVLDRKSVV